VRLINVLLDGWDLLYAPQGSPALHLLTLLATCPADVRYTVAMPDSPPHWLPRDVQVSVVPTANTAWRRLIWEQRVLPAVARQTAADLLHLTAQTPPLTISIPVVVSPSDCTLREHRAGWISRLRGALTVAGMSRVRALFWPADLPPAQANLPVYTLPPVVHPGFVPGEHSASKLPQGVVLAEAYVLYPAVLNRTDLNRLLNVWSWVYSSVGEYFHLLLPGLSADQRGEVQGSFARYGLKDSLQILPPINPLALPSLYHQSLVVFQMGSSSAWANPARNALVGGKPFVASFSEQMDAIVGPSAYLTPAEDERAQGAALITVLIEESLSEQLSQAARQRSSAWGAADYILALREAYLDILSP
jgi:glycosyltransferase involved in cell wall biosynthesis